MDHDSYYFDSQYQNYYDSENENGNFCEVGSQNETDGDALLISLVRDHPYLYNKELTDFKDNLKKQNAWTEIGSILNMTVDECQSRWTRLRERYTREKKQRQEETSSGSGLSKRKAFEFFKNMSFLEPFVKRRRTVTNVFSNSSSSLPKQYTLQKNFSSNNEKENNFSLANAITFIEQNSSKNIKSPEQNRYKTSSDNEVNVSSTKAATAIGQSFTDVKNSAHLK
ncbi:uncharacterized protein LOC116850697 isoform X2 [Odontomachus brunneus]|nr:uncharacterized protein LOC116850697 isoform X2 [Odontomachus brunneus]